MIIILAMLAVFYCIVIGILYVTKRSTRTFADYAVGGRSFGPWYVAMCYTNSWWPGTVFISFAGLTVSAGILGYYGVAYAVLGVAFMYFMATRAWRWGKKFNLMTQPDLLGMRFGSKAVRLVASVIGVVAIFPWVVLGMQSLAAIFRVASNGTWSVTACLAVGLAVIVVRQIWTVQMGMRGLVITDMFQGLVAYVVSALVCLVVLADVHSPASWSHLSVLPTNLLRVPGDGGHYGPFYLFSLVFTGVIGSLCWPMSFQRIYTASSVRSVKKATVRTILIAGGFYAVLTTTMLAAAHIANIAANPQDGWFMLMQDYGGIWLLGLGVVIVFAASMGHIDGSVQVAGTQIANDIVGVFRNLSDRKLTIVAKGSMAVYMLIAGFVAYLTFGMSRLQLLAQLSYQGIVQIAVPLFLGMFFRKGNRQGALWGMISGFVVALVLTVIYPDDIPGLGSLTSGIVGVAVNLAVYLIASVVVKPTEAESRRINELFETGRDRRPVPAVVNVRSVAGLPIDGMARREA